MVTLYNLFLHAIRSSYRKGERRRDERDDLAELSGSVSSNVLAVKLGSSCDDARRFILMLAHHMYYWRSKGIRRTRHIQSANGASQLDRSADRPRILASMRVLCVCKCIYGRWWIRT